MTLLLLMNLGFGASGVAAPTFKAAWARSANMIAGPVTPVTPVGE